MNDETPPAEPTSSTALPLGFSTAPSTSAGAAADTAREGIACVRHPHMLAATRCTDCTASLCSACSRSVDHHRCPACRSARDEQPHVVGMRWAFALTFDALIASLRAFPRRAPAVLGLVAASLALALGAAALDALDDADKTEVLEAAPAADDDGVADEAAQDAAEAAQLQALIESGTPHDPGDDDEEEDDTGEVAFEPGVDSDGDGMTDIAENRWAHVVPVAACYYDEDDGRPNREARQEARAAGCAWFGVSGEELYDAEDSDADGIPDRVEKLRDGDDDGVPDFVDPLRGDDEDGDHLKNRAELAAGTSPFSNDTDGDGIGDFVETNGGQRVDTDQDGDVDGVDDDSDDDGDDDATERCNYALFEEQAQNDEELDESKCPLLDTDRDGTPDFRDGDDDGDGILSSIEGEEWDSDDDGVPAPLDLDSDGDGKLDAVEGLTDSDGDGTADAYDAVHDPAEGAEDADDAPAIPVEAALFGLDDDLVLGLFIFFVILGGLAWQPLASTPLLQRPSRRRRALAGFGAVLAWAASVLVLALLGEEGHAGLAAWLSMGACLLLVPALLALHGIARDGLGGMHPVDATLSFAWSLPQLALVHVIVASCITSLALFVAMPILVAVVAVGALAGADLLMGIGGAAAGIAALLVIWIGQGALTVASARLIDDRARLR